MTDMRDVKTKTSCTSCNLQNQQYVIDVKCSNKFITQLARSSRLELTS